MLLRTDFWIKLGHFNFEHLLYKKNIPQKKLVEMAVLTLTNELIIDLAQQIEEMQRIKNMPMKKLVEMAILTLEQ